MRPLRLMPLGGSITQGIGSPDGHGYRAELLRLLTQARPFVPVGSRTAHGHRHEGWRGFRIDQIDAKARMSVPKLRPDVFTLNAGSNDCLQDLDIPGIGGRMGNLLEYLWTASPGSTVILSTLVVCRDEEVLGPRILDANSAFRHLVQSNTKQGNKIVLADMHTHGPVVADLGDDGIHPGTLGYNKMAAVWYDAIQEADSKGFLPRSPTQ